MAEILLCSLLPVLFDRLASRELLKLASQEGLRSKLKEWERKLKMIQAVLNDAEEKQLRNEAVKLWLQDLQDLAYDAEDILDEFATEALRRKLMAKHQASTSKARKLIPSFFNNFAPSVIKFDFSMRSRIKVITSRLEELCKERHELGLQIIPGGTPTTVLQRQPSTSVPTEPTVYGRDGDKAKILEWVLTDEPSDSNFCVMAIVGMGGIGKTTLAREVYNDKSVDDFKFDIKAWVCISDDFDVLRVSKVVLESITSSQGSPNDLNEVQVQLRRVLNGKKFLLVLDDVWNKNYALWEILKAPFMASAPGSKLIVTTRHVDVALIMGSIECYNLKSLSDSDCWSLFVKHAFHNRDIDSLQCSELIRKRVVEMCKGLPLAARTLGGLVRSKPGDDAWEDILSSKIWDFIYEESDILPVLKLSYYHLPAHLKRCFAYCSIFPKGYEFDKKELVLLWVAEGFIQPSTNNKRLEDLGCQYFHDLLSRSLFQQSMNNSSKFEMHDLIHDLAQLVSGDTSFRSEEANKSKIRFEMIRHASYISYCDKNKFEVFQNFDRLRTFLHIWPREFYFHNYCIPPVGFYHFVQKCKKLRVLSLRQSHVARLPDLIGGLRHLRYLNLCYTRIKSLPESTSSLFNLQALLLRNCRCLTKLPSNMKYLINMRHLDISGENLLKEMPLGMAELKDLQMLSNFIVGRSSGSGLEDLKHLKFLRGELCISRLENAHDLRAAKEMILTYHKDLEVLSLLWQSQFDDSRSEQVEESILDMLQPHKNLKELTIAHYGGARFSSWVGDPSFSNLVVLKLENCKKCKTLPALGLLDSLKELSIVGMANIKILGSEFYGKDCLKPFPLLEALYFEDLQQWECWDSNNGNEHIKGFPRLRVLSIDKCPKLTGKLPDYLPSLEELVIRECAQLVVAYVSYPMLRNLEIDECKGIVCNGNPIHSKSLNSMTLSKVTKIGNWLKHGCFHNVEYLNIGDCEEFTYLWQNISCVEKPLQGMHRFSSLKELRIENCTSLDFFPEVNFLSNLSSLNIRNCKALKSLHQGMKHNNTCLKSLEIHGCDSLTFIVRGMLPSSLESLQIYNCEKLQCLMDNRDDTCISSSSSSRGQLPFSLKFLYIFYCPKLKSIREGLYHLSCLQRLLIYDCPSIVSFVERALPNTNLTSLSKPKDLHEIDNCPSMVSFPGRELPKTNLIDLFIDSCEKLEALPDCIHNLNSLEELSIKQCPSIKYFPEEGIPTNLKSLSISGDLKIYKPLIRWGLHKLISLRSFTIDKCSDAVSFPEEEILPISLTFMEIKDFSRLEYLSSTGFQRLTSLQELWIVNCPKLKSFPKEGLPSSLSQLHIIDCPLLKERCKRDEEKEWSRIAHIPHIEIDFEYINDI